MYGSDVSLPWADVELFLAVAETGSFSSAARQLSITQPTVSRRIAALEESLGRPLFQRNVEGAHLTPEGERLLPAAQQMARWAAEVERSVAGWDESLNGVVRIAAPPGIAYDLLVPFAKTLRSCAPGVRLELLTGVEHIDLTRGQADIALRTRRPNQPDLLVALTLRAALGIFAAPSYARQLKCSHKRLLCPSEIDWITWSYPNERQSPRPELEQLIPNFRPVFASNDYLAQQRAMALGLGAMILPRIYHHTQSSGRLVELPVDLPLPETHMYVVCPKTMRWVPRVQLVLEQLRALLLSVEGAAEA